MVKNSLTGKQRLTIFFALLWMTLIGFLSTLAYSFNWVLFIGIGVFPVAFIWGVIWVVAGFKKD